MPKVLSDHPDIRQLRRQAKELLKSARSGDAEATKQLADAAAKPEQPPSLSNAQLVVAREYGFDSWPKLRLAVADANGETTEPLPTGPMFRTKYRSKDPVYTPKKFLDGALAAGWEPGRLPDSLIFTFHNVYAKLLAEDDRFEINTKLAPSNATMFTTVEGLPAIGVTCLSGGSGAMIGQIENQVQLKGATRFVIVGTAGTISPDVSVGDLIVVNSAVRDDGISQHYLPPDTYVDADVELTAHLKATLRACNLNASDGTTWTSPAIYRSTPEEVAYFAAEGVGIVETEIASLLAVTEALGVAGAAVATVVGSHIDDDAEFVVRPPSPGEVLNGTLAALGLD